MATIALHVDGQATPYHVHKTLPWWRRPIGEPLPTYGQAKSYGLWIAPSRTLSTWWMNQAVDAVFLNADGTVARIVTGVRPWRTVRCQEARSVLKLRAGMARRLGLAPGTALDLAT